MRAGVTSILSENVIVRMLPSPSKAADTTPGAASSFTVTVLPNDCSIGLPSVPVTAESATSNRGDAMAATERPWPSVSSMEITVESASVPSVAPASETDCPEPRMVNPDRSAMPAGVTSTALANSISKMPVPSSKTADVSSGPEVRATSIIWTPLPK